MPTEKRIRSHHQVLASTSRAAVLELLRGRAEPLGVDEIATAVGLHQNTVRGHLDLLVSAGYVVRRSEPPRGPGRPRVVYEVVAYEAMEPEAARRADAAADDRTNYRLLAEVLTQHLVGTSARPGEEAVRAGRGWAGARPADGPRAAVSVDVALTEVVRLLADSGFAPELSADASTIDLHHCPFRDLAQAHPEVVCGAHLGILQGALAELGAPVTATRLLPLVRPDLCVATLERRPA